MSGVIDDNGQQWERCNGCGEYVPIESLRYEQPSERCEYGRDLCASCAPDQEPVGPAAVIHHVQGHTFDPNIAVRITAEDPREVMTRIFGQRWSMEYTQRPDDVWIPRGVLVVQDGGFVPEEEARANG